MYVACTLPFFKEGEAVKKTDGVIPKTEYYPGTNRPLLRPEIRWGKAMVFFASVLATDIALAVLGVLYKDRLGIRMGSGALFTILFLSLGLLSLWIFGKRIAIFIVRVYQKKAPYHIRSACCLVPNCSEYMILSIRKYGLVRGIRRGYARMKRCGTMDTTEDYP